MIYGSGDLIASMLSRVLTHGGSVVFPLHTALHVMEGKMLLEELVKRFFILFDRIFPLL
jgi:hypothetical protein